MRSATWRCVKQLGSVRKVLSKTPHDTSQWDHCCITFREFVEARLLRFGWFAAEDCKERGEGKPETIDFLGFTRFCSQTKNGMFVVGRTTISKRMRAMLKEIRAQLHRSRHEPVPVIGQWLSQLFRGYCNYYHVPGNTRRLDAFRR